MPLQLKPEFVVEAAWFDNITDQWIQMVANEYLDMTIQEGINRVAERLAFDHLPPPNFDVRANQGLVRTIKHHDEWVADAIEGKSPGFASKLMEKLNAVVAEQEDTQS